MTCSDRTNPTTPHPSPSSKRIFKAKRFRDVTKGHKHCFLYVWALPPSEALESQCPLVIPISLMPTAMVRIRRPERRIGPAVEVAPVRLTHKLAAAIDGIDLSTRHVGDRLALPPREARLLVAEGWAEPVAGRERRGRPTP